MIKLIETISVSIASNVLDLRIIQPVILCYKSLHIFEWKFITHINDFQSFIQNFAAKKTYARVNIVRQSIQHFCTKYFYFENLLEFCSNKKKYERAKTQSPGFFLFIQINCSRFCWCCWWFWRILEYIRIDCLFYLMSFATRREYIWNLFRIFKDEHNKHSHLKNYVFCTQEGFQKKALNHFNSFYKKNIQEI